MLGLALFFIWSLNTSFVLKPASLIEFERDSRLTAEPQDFCARTDLQNVYLSPEFSSHAWLFGSCRLWLMWSRILLILQEKNPSTKVLQVMWLFKEHLSFWVFCPLFIEVFSHLLTLWARLAGRIVDFWKENSTWSLLVLVFSGYYNRIL